MKHLFAFLLLWAAVAELAVVEDAEAGVLIRRVRSRFRSRVQQSTAALRKTQPRIRAEEIGTVDDDVRIAKSYAKYQKRLERWERNRIKAEEKAARQREREKAKEKREEEKKLRAFKREHEKAQRKKAYELREANFGREEEDDGKITQSSRGAAGEQEERPKKRQSFWARFWNALMGRSSSKEAPAPKAPEQAKPAAAKVEKKPAAETTRAKKPAEPASPAAGGEEASGSIHDRLFAPRK